MSQFSWSWRKCVAGLFHFSKPNAAIGRRAQLKVEALEDRLVQSTSSFLAPIMFSPPTGTGQTGETAHGHGPKGVFEIKDFSFGIENPTTIGSAAGGTGAGKIKFNEFTITKNIDSASPVFFKNCCAGTHYDTVVIDMRKAGGDPKSAGKPFLQYKFDTVFTTKIDWSGPGDEGPEESITFVYGKLQVKYLSKEPTALAGGSQAHEDVAFIWF
jgi:type VI secretion system Hcp family effector